MLDAPAAEAESLIDKANDIDLTLTAAKRVTAQRTQRDIGPVACTLAPQDHDGCVNLSLDIHVNIIGADAAATNLLNVVPTPAHTRAELKLMVEPFNEQFLGAVQHLAAFGWIDFWNEPRIIPFRDQQNGDLCLLEAHLQVDSAIHLHVHEVIGMDKLIMISWPSHSVLTACSTSRKELRVVRQPFFALNFAF